MDKLLRPERLEVDPSSSVAALQWIHWHRSFENFMEATKATESKVKLNLLINYISPTVYEYISECITYENATEILKNLYVKPRNEIFARHSLATRRQQAGESIDQYLQILKQMSKECNFKSVTADQNRDEFIRDSFISGLSSSHIRQRLLENITLTVKEAYDKARALEMAQQHSELYSPIGSFNGAAATIDDTLDNSPTISAVTSKCFFCGFDRHPRDNCPAKMATCHHCGKRGHFSKVCRSRNNSTKPIKQTSAAILATISAASPACLSKSILQIEVNGILIDALIDTGSSDSYLSSKVTKEWKIKIFPINTHVAMASTSLISKVKGYCIVKLKILQYTYKDIKLLVLDELCADMIIGHDILKEHSGVEVIFGGPKSPLRICSLALVNVEPFPLFSNLNSKCKPIAVKSRRYTFADSKFIQEEVQRLLSENIIEPSNSPWRAQVLITTNENHKKRMVIDYSQTINKFTSLDAYPLPRIEDIVTKISKYNMFSTIDLRSAYHQIPIKDNEKLYTAFEACGGLYQFRRIPFGVTNGVACFQRTIDYIIKKEKLQDVFAYLDDVTICGKDKLHHDHNLQLFMNATRKYSLTLNSEKCMFSSESINLLGYTITRQTIKPDQDRLNPLLELPLPNNNISLRRVMGMFSHYSKWVPNFSKKIQPLVQCNKFPMSEAAISAFETLKQDIVNAVVISIDDDVMLTVETDASEFAIAAQLSQQGKPVAFFSRTLSTSERRHSSVEKEAYAIVEAIRKWRHFLLGRHFRLITDQRSVAFMFDNKVSGKIKNEKIMRWRLELSCYKYDIIYRSGNLNTVADMFSRISSATESNNNLYQLHNSLCHPGITRLYHWIRCKNLPYSIDDVRKITSSCPICAELKPRFHKNKGILIKATAPFERLNIDFKGPLQTSSSNRYILTVIDEFSRFPFVFPCSDMTSDTVIKCLRQLFSIFGVPSFLHSDRGTSFVSQELKEFLVSHGISVSHTTAYNPQGNGQCERYNGIIWKTVLLALKSKDLKLTQWELVLPDALHSIRSLLCTATNCTPHDRMFSYARRSSSGSSIPTWLATPGPVFLKKHVRNHKYEPLVEEVELIHANTDYAHVRLSNGNETTVSIRHLAPRGDVSYREDQMTTIPQATEARGAEGETSENTEIDQAIVPGFSEEVLNVSTDISVDTSSYKDPNFRTGSRPLRNRQPPKYLDNYIQN